MTTTLRLLAADLHYPDELKVYTAASGPVGTLSELYLVIEQSDGFSGLGEVRANIEYLTKIPAEKVAPSIRELSRRLPWSAEPETLIAFVAGLAGEFPSIARAAFENALVEGIARRNGVPVADFLGGVWAPSVATNQCLFWGPDEQFDRLAKRYVSEGFRDLKVRIGIGEFESDLARLQRVRDVFGDFVNLSADANGSWPVDEALDKLSKLERFNLSYVEQPTEPGDWDAFTHVSKHCKTPLMVDEGLAGPADIDRLIEIGAPALGHLKIAKLGGPLQVVSAARRLQEAGVDVMVGQMNEGALATAMTAHCAMAASPKHAELYGCYGLLNDPADGVSYRDGSIFTPGGAGLGLRFDAAECKTLWTENFA